MNTKIIIFSLLTAIFAAISIKVKPGLYSSHDNKYVFWLAGLLTIFFAAMAFISAMDKLKSEVSSPIRIVKVECIYHDNKKAPRYHRFSSNAGAIKAGEMVDATYYCNLTYESEDGKKTGRLANVPSETLLRVGDIVNFPAEFMKNYKPWNSENE